MMRGATNRQQNRKKPEMSAKDTKIKKREEATRRI